MLSKKFSHTKLKGFTLVEILVVIAILGILVAIAVYGVEQARKRARWEKIKGDLLKVKLQLENDVKDNDQDYSKIPGIGYCTWPPSGPGTGSCENNANLPNFLSGKYKDLFLDLQENGVTEWDVRLGNGTGKYYLVVEFPGSDPAKYYCLDASETGGEQDDNGIPGQLRCN